ncbi:MAG: hypothetical protein PHG19_07670 [Anaerotignum sp.]|nr:hypothetical protein [Anaerotignum sp.]
MEENDVIKIVKCCENTFELDKLKLSEGYFYNNLPLCIIDAIYSIGVRYTSTRNTVLRYCQHYEIRRIRETSEFPSELFQHRVCDLIQNIKQVSPDIFAKEILKNKQRTSSRNGILKAEAVLLWAETLDKLGIQSLQDFNTKYSMTLEHELKKIHGQSSGISLTYLRMLAGNDNFVKPDRHIIKFLSNCVDKNVEIASVQKLMEDIVGELSKDYKHMTVRLLDHAIWGYMSKESR